MESTSQGALINAVRLGKESHLPLVERDQRRLREGGAIRYLTVFPGHLLYARGAWESNKKQPSKVMEVVTKCFRTARRASPRLAC